MTTQPQREAILAAVDQAFEAQVKFTSKFVETASLRGSEGAAQDLLEAAYRQIGLEIDRWALDAAGLSTHPGAGAVTVDYSRTDVVVGTFHPQHDGGRSLILNGHVDVVPTGSEELWSQGPFESPVRDGWLYGRGAADMKAGLVANHFALAALHRAGLRPTARIHLQSVPEEECTGNGTLSALLRGYRADAVIIPEPTAGRLVRAHLGVIWFKVRVVGIAAHAAMMAEGTNAIDAAIALVADLRRLESAWNQDRSGYFADEPHPFNFNMGTIHGGDWASSVPDWCEFEMRIGFPPERSVQDAWADVQAAIERSSKENPALRGMAATASKSGFYSDGYVLEPESDAETALTAAFAGATGRALEEAPMAGYLDSRVYGLFAGTPSLVMGPVGERIHGADERVNLESLREVTRTIALFIADWCGVEEG